MATCSTIKQRIHAHAYMYAYTEQQKPEKQPTFKPIYVKKSISDCVIFKS